MGHCGPNFFYSDVAVTPALAGIADVLDSWWTFDGDMLDRIGSAHLSGGPATYVSTTTGQRINPSTAMTGPIQPALTTQNFSMGGRFTLINGVTKTFICQRRTGTNSYEIVYFNLKSNGKIEASFNPYQVNAVVLTSTTAFLSFPVTPSLLLTYNGAMLCLYVNGVLESSVATTLTPPSDADHFEFGYVFSADYSTDFDGCFVCHAALTAAQAAALHNGGSGVTLTDVLAAGSMRLYGAFPSYQIGTPYDATIDVVGVYTPPLVIDSPTGGIPPGLTLELDGTGTKARLHGTPIQGMTITGTLPSSSTGVFYSHRLQVNYITGSIASVDIAAGAMPAWMTMLYHSDTQEIEFYGTPP